LKSTMRVNGENGIGLSGSHLGHIFLILTEIIEDILVIEDYHKGRYLLKLKENTEISIVNNSVPGAFDSRPRHQ